MSERTAISSGFLLEPIVTRAYVAHPDTGAALTKAEVTSAWVFVYFDHDQKSEHDEQLNLDDVWFDTLQSWPDDDLGYNFRHILRYGDPVEWVGGSTVRVEYIIETNALGGFTVVLTHAHSVESMRTREIPE